MFGLNTSVSGRQDSARDVLFLRAKSTMEQAALREQMRQDVDSLDGPSLEHWLKEPAADAPPDTLSLHGIEVVLETSAFLCAPSRLM